MEASFSLGISSDKNSNLYNSYSDAYKEHLLPESVLNNRKWLLSEKKEHLEEYKELVKEKGKKRTRAWLKDHVVICSNLAILTGDRRYIRIACYTNSLAKAD